MAQSAVFLEFPSHRDHCFRDAWVKVMVCMVYGGARVARGPWPRLLVLSPLDRQGEAEAQSHIPPRSCGDLMVSWVGLEPRSPAPGGQVLDHTPPEAPPGQHGGAREPNVSVPRKSSLGLGVSGMTERA